MRQDKVLADTENLEKVLTPSDLLKKLVCSVCKLYLSLFPVYIRRDGDSAICGRCKVPNDDYIRDEAYEGIAQFLYFPCAEEKNGCTDQLTPLQLKDHEPCCVLRRQDCPSRGFSFCDWRGPNKDLKAHFDAAHKTLVLTERTFEINFVSSSNEVLLIPFQDELFLVKKEIDSKTGTFVCSCTQIILKVNPDKFNYFVRIQTGNSTYYHKFPERSTEPTWEERTKVTIDEIKDVLHNPPVVVAVIEFVKAAINVGDEHDKTAEVKVPGIDWESLKSLECPVCLEYVRAPIYQCIKGHSICNNCIFRLEQCPLCRERIGATQNFALEKVVELMMYPCRYYKSGCSVALQSFEIKRHEDSCLYGPYDCPLGQEANCLQKFTKDEIMAHVDQNHHIYVLRSDKVNVPFYRSNPIEDVKLIKFSNRLFKVCFKYDDDSDKFYWAVQLVGPTEDCKNFKFEIDLIDHSDKQLRQYVRRPCAPLLTANYFEKKENYVFFHYDQISEYIDKSLSYRIRILKDSVG